MPTTSLATIVRWIEKKKTVKEQAQVMKDHASGALKDIIGYAMDPGVKWLIPETDPPYNPSPDAADIEGRLYTETRRFIYLVDSPDGRALAAPKREQMFIQMLESIDKKDAVLLLRVKNKNLAIKPDAVKLAFPSLTKLWP